MSDALSDEFPLGQGIYRGLHTPPPFYGDPVPEPTLGAVDSKDWTGVSEPEWPGFERTEAFDTSPTFAGPPVFRWGMGSLSEVAAPGIIFPDGPPVAGDTISVTVAPIDNNPKTRFGIKKPSFRLIPGAAIVHEAVVFMLGAAKYGAFNWRKNQVSASVYVDAALRHIESWHDGEEVDPESGASHLAHARACLAIILDALETGNLIDDRPPAGVTSMLIARYAQTGTLGQPETKH